MDAIVAVALAALLFAGRASLRRSVLLVAATASASLVASTVLTGVSLYHPASRADTGFVASAIGLGVAEALTVTLTYVAWGLLLYAAVQTRRWGWFAALVIAMAVTLAVPTTLLGGGLPLSLVPLVRSLLQTNQAVGTALLLAFEQMGALVVLVFALLVPTTPTAGSTLPAAQSGE